VPGFSYLANVRFWPRLCEKSNIHSQIGVAQNFNPLFVSLSEIVVATSKFSTLFLAKYFVASA
jgi:hypothetical protein